MTVTSRSHFRPGWRPVSAAGRPSPRRCAPSRCSPPKWLSCGARMGRGVRLTWPQAAGAHLLPVLGDSLAFGYSQAKFDETLPRENPADYETGYVNDFANVLKVFNPGLRSSTMAARGRPRIVHQRAVRLPARSSRSTTPTEAPTLAALRRGCLPGSSPGQRQPNHDRHRRQRRAGADRDHLQTGAACVAAGAPAVFAKSAPTSA